MSEQAKLIFTNRKTKMSLFEEDLIEETTIEQVVLPNGFKFFVKPAGS